MKKIIATLALLLVAVVTVNAQDFFTKADAFFKKNVERGRVDYPGIKASPAELNDLVKDIANYSLKGKSADHQKAFLINAYNILTIKNVVNHYPIKRPLDVDGFFEKVTFTVAGSKTTLNDIENEKIRPVYNDARIHFALVCAAKSCPPLQSYAYMPSKLNAQLEAVTKKAFNDAKFVQVDASGKAVAFSKIMEWYKDDFLAESKSLIGYANRYRSTPIPTGYKVSHYTYNWALNVKR